MNPNQELLEKRHVTRIERSTRDSADALGKETSITVRPPGGQLARLGVWSASHFRVVLLAWAIVLLLFGAFAPRVEHALAGAGWQDSTSQSVKARQVIQKEFGGLGATALQVVVVDHRAPLAADPAARSVMAKALALLRADPRVSVVVPPQPGVSLSANGRTGVITGGANAGANAMVAAADTLAGPLHQLSGRASLLP